MTNVLLFLVTGWLALASWVGLPWNERWYDSQGRAQATALVTPSLSIPVAPAKVTRLLVSPGPITPSGSLTVSYRVDVTNGSPLFAFPPEGCLATPASVGLYVEHAQWQGTPSCYTVKRGKKTQTVCTTTYDPNVHNFYRWWHAPSRLPLSVGTHTITAPIAQLEWTSVMRNPPDPSPEATAGWHATWANLGAVGLSFGGGCYLGHGVSVTGGTASFTVTDFDHLP